MSEFRGGERMGNSAGSKRLRNDFDASDSDLFVQRRKAERKPQKTGEVKIQKENEQGRRIETKLKSEQNV